MELDQEYKDSSWIVIPAFNAEKSIAKVVRDILGKGFNNIVVVDDCSSDGTASIAARLPVHLLKHIINRGQGAALKTGIDFALLLGAKFIVTFDADDQHRVEDLETLIRPVASNNFDITMGSRFLDNRTEMPFSRRLTLKIAVVIQGLFYGIWLSDAHNGLRCFSRKAAEEITISSDRMEHASEIVEEVQLKKLSYKEIPVTVFYSRETLQKGQGGIFQAIKVFWKMLFKTLSK